ncbi:DUF4118 domain-containing protein [Streptomyces sp. WAC06614]|uniref:DUF4118 domain-containing protein n=1 Tax=Streptomyces sp. WAC06614 TaxID=2487416 RepID=UPI000F7897F7|nr:DUF4118 domain-containing protein [Streptomyces sp. WAC06614]RSS64732.1 DUF4118 domain-containing protein [Streptomyces sp. WAC06614]
MTLSRSRLRTYGVLAAALVVPFLVALALVPFRTRLTGTNAALVLVVAVVAVAARGSRLTGAVAALSAAAWFDFLLVPPYLSFGIAGHDDVVTAVLLLVTGLLVGQLAVRTQRMQSAVAVDEADLERLRATARLTEEGTPPEAVVEYVRGELVALLNLRGCRYEPGTPAGMLPRLEHDGSVWRGLEAGGGEAELWPDEWPEGPVELRVTGGGHPYGRFLLDPRPGALPSHQARLVAGVLAAQAGTALDMAQPKRER